ncbi:hypothetical protein Cfor_09409 [Coptotermes formosanus]|uniref:Uncharacterized protein n=1 Tax=Coptotermes formosanus TaxID=36987 RepID=A0A6L2PVW6_COPFO|nr:hypothetical protein Cfor_09409 [Coptotermes formosanus]
MASAARTRVVKGEGVCHSHKVKYSTATDQLLKALLEESKLSNLHRQQIQKSLHNGDSLPPPSSGRTIRSGGRGLTNATVKNYIFHKKRTQEAIILSGAYERDPFVPIHPKVDKEKEKMKLQSLMACGKIIPSTPVHKMHLATRAPQNILKHTDRFAELTEDVQDCLEFLSEMRELGYEKKYRPIIEHQIAAKVGQMKAINPQRCQELRILDHLHLTRSKPQA